MVANITISEMYCTQCGKRNIPIPRKKGQGREPGHLKKMYCIYCKKKTNMVEIKEIGSKYTYELFKMEFDYHNFNKDGTRKLSIGDLKNHVYNGGGVLD